MLSTGSLEEENKALKTEYCRLAQQTDDVEAKEQLLLQDITGQLGKLLCKNLELIVHDEKICFYHQLVPIQVWVC